MSIKRNTFPVSTLVFTLLALLNATGCGKNDVASVWPTPRSLGNGLSAYRAGTDATTAQETAAPAFEEPMDELLLNDALALALMRNPKLASASWQVRADEAAALQAGASPNPEIRVQLDDFGGSGRFSGTGDSEQRIRLSQVIELGDKAERRRHHSHLEAALSGWDYETARLDVILETTQAFVAVQAAQERLAAAQEMHKKVEEIMESVARRVKIGKGSRTEADEARIALAASQISLDRADGDLAAKRGVLASTWDAETPTFGVAIGMWDNLPGKGLPPFEKIFAHITDNPDVARWETEGQMRQAAIELERASAVPDVRALLTAKRLEDSGDHGYTVALEVPLPLFDRNTAAVREARMEQAKAASDRRVAVMTATAALREAYGDFITASQEAKLRRTVSTPAAQAAADTTGRILATGLVTDLDLLKAYRTLFKERVNFIDALEMYHTARADVERLIARPLETEDDQAANDASK